MKAVRWHARREVSLDEVAGPLLADDHGVVVKVEACGVCGTDFEEARYGPKAIPVGAPNPTTGLSAPITLGHEIVGAVIEAGPASGRRLGERVAIWPQVPCRECETCTGGDEHRCPRLGVIGLSAHGGFAPFVAVDGRSVVPLPDDLPLERAVLVEPYAVSIHAFDSHPPTDKTVLVLGIGSVGLALVETASFLGARRVIAVSRSPLNREAAIRAGADEVFAPGKGPAEVVDLAVDASGSDDALLVVGRTLVYGGTAVLVGVRSKVVPAPIWDIFSRQLRFVGSNGMRLAEFSHAARLIADGRLARRQRPTISISLARLPDTLLAGEPGTHKIVAIAD